jgi:hypothetical protein
LQLLPGKISKDMTANHVAITKHVKFMSTLDLRLMAVALDCIMTASKICVFLTYDINQKRTKTSKSKVEQAKLASELSDLQETLAMLIELVEQLMMANVLQDLQTRAGNML